VPRCSGREIVYTIGIYIIGATASSSSAQHDCAPALPLSVSALKAPTSQHESFVGLLASMAAGDVRSGGRAVPGCLQRLPVNLYGTFCATSCLRSLYGLMLSCSSGGDTVGIMTMVTSTAEKAVHGSCTRPSQPGGTARWSCGSSRYPIDVGMAENSSPLIWLALDSIDVQYLHFPYNSIIKIRKEQQRHNLSWQITTCPLEYGKFSGHYIPTNTAFALLIFLIYT
jgi:hypothetical protein